MKDRLLEKIFEPERWLAAISKGCDKSIRKDQLIPLTRPSVRGQIYVAIRDGKYKVAPPHAALIPKDTPGEFRRVFVNEPVDRVLLSIINDVLFETCPDMIHRCCRSYLKGTGCGKVVKELVKAATSVPGEEAGWKADLSKYFDSVPVAYIDDAFDKVEKRSGPSAVLDLLRDYYHSDLYFDEGGNLVHGFQSLKQGCSVAAFLADCVLRDTDEKLSRLDGYYVRYSDDMLFVGKDRDMAMQILKDDLASMQMSLNPKKVEPVRKDRWFKFLGYAIKGQCISLSGKHIKNFQEEIRSRTVDAKENVSINGAVASVNRYLYKGNGQFSWATHILPICNVRKDIDTLNAYVMDCLRAVMTGKKNVGGLGYSTSLKEGCIARGKGANVRFNRDNTPEHIEGYRTIGCMQNAFLTSRQAYETLMRTL